MKKQFWIPSFLHFFIDFFSVYALVQFKGFGLSVNDYFLIVYGYDCLAFLSQPLLGTIFEKSEKLKYWSTLGCGLVILGTLIPQAFIAIFFLGVGNGLFHSIEGQLILKKASKTSPLGVFISFGSLGLGLALTFLNIFLFWVCMSVFMILIVLSVISDIEKLPTIEMAKPEDHGKTYLFIVFLIVIGVILRGFFGQYTNYGWVPLLSGYSSLCLSTAVFIGKFTGGFIIDKIGSFPVILLSTLLSFGTCFFQDNIYASLIDVMAINLLMALTLDYIRTAMPKHIGLGFGMLASSLFIGYTIAVYMKDCFSFQNWIVPCFILCNCFSLISAGKMLSRNSRIKMVYYKKRGGK